MWYTHRVWMKGLNTESAYRSMGGVTMSPSLPASWSSWELGGVWNHCCLDVGKRGKGLFGTWKNRNRIRETSNRACAWDHKAGPDHWKLLSLQWSVAAEEPEHWCLSVSWSCWFQALLHSCNISQWDAWGNILVLVLNNFWKWSQKLDPNKLLSLVD